MAIGVKREKKLEIILIREYNVFNEPNRRKRKCRQWQSEFICA